jgi:enoyl-CoA hydratase
VQEEDRVELALGTDRMIARIEDGIGWMIFNNPERRNAMSLDMQRAIPEILGRFNDDPDVRVVVMTGSGDRAFVSGADISEFDEHRASPEAIADYNRISANTAAAFEALEKPLLAMIRGFCMGGGLLTAIRADIRVASDDSVFGIPAARLGLGYSFENTNAVVRQVGASNAAEILFTGRRFTADEAMAMNLVNRVVPVEDLEPSVRELATTIATNAPITLRLVRESIRQAQLPEDRRDLARVRELVDACMSSEDYAEGRRAFMEKRPPQFRGV